MVVYLPWISGCSHDALPFSQIYDSRKLESCDKSECVSISPPSDAAVSLLQDAMNLLVSSQ